MSARPSRPLIVWGAGGHASVVADAARGTFDVIALLDDTPHAHVRTWQGLPVWAGRDALAGRAGQATLIVAVGANDARLRLAAEAEAMGFELACVVHPRAVVAPDVALGAGTVVMAGAVINPGTVVGRCAIVNTSASVDHDCRLDDGAHVGPGVHLGGHVTVGAGAWIGLGAAVRDRVQIGAGAMVGVGSAVVSDVPAHTVAYGVPARPQQVRP